MSSFNLDIALNVRRHHTAIEPMRPSEGHCCHTVQSELWHPAQFSGAANPSPHQHPAVSWAIPAALQHRHNRSGLPLLPWNEDPCEGRSLQNTLIWQLHCGASSSTHRKLTIWKRPWATIQTHKYFSTCRSDLTSEMPPHCQKRVHQY